MSKPDGGLAFPSDGPDGTPGYSGGMTLRDYFAAHATDEDVRWWRIAAGTDTGKIIAPATREAAKYAYADAMIRERDR